MLDIHNSLNTVCPPVQWHNPRAFASGLSRVQVDKLGSTVYTLLAEVRLYTGDVNVKG